MTSSAVVRKLRIERFRGLRSFEWRPAAGSNVILGGGDVGKTTILDAIALLLHPTSNYVLSEFDYIDRDVEAEFEIAAVLSLPVETGINDQLTHAWPWEWNGSEAVVPAANDPGEGQTEPQEPVYCIRVRGTRDLEVLWEIVQPNDETIFLGVGLRRQIGIVRLSGDDRNDRDLRLVFGSALDRLVADKALRSRINQQLAEIDLQSQLAQDSKDALARLGSALHLGSLPHDLELVYVVSPYGTTGTKF